MIRDDIDPAILLDSIRTEFKYKYPLINTAMLPLWVRILPHNTARVNVCIDTVEKSLGILKALDKWFKDIELTEIEYAEYKKDTDRKTD